MKKKERELFNFSPEYLERFPELKKWQGKPVYTVQELQEMYDKQGIPYIKNINGTDIEGWLFNGSIIGLEKIIKHW